MFWTGGVLGVEAPAAEIAASVRSLGVSCGQIGVHAPDLGDGTVEAWRSALEENGITVVSAFPGFTGESYASIPTCAATVGYVPPATRDERRWGINGWVIATKMNPGAKMPTVASTAPTHPARR